MSLAVGTAVDAEGRTHPSVLGQKDERGIWDPPSELGTSYLDAPIPGWSTHCDTLESITPLQGSLGSPGRTGEVKAWLVAGSSSFYAIKSNFLLQLLVNMPGFYPLFVPCPLFIMTLWL